MSIEENFWKTPPRIMTLEIYRKFLEYCSKNIPIKYIAKYLHLSPRQVRHYKAKCYSPYTSEYKTPRRKGERMTVVLDMDTYGKVQEKCFKKGYTYSRYLALLVKEDLK